MKGFLIILGVLALVLGVGLMGAGLYGSFVTCLYSGIMELVVQYHAPAADPGSIALAIMKIVFFEIPLAVGIVLGAILVAWGFFV